MILRVLNEIEKKFKQRYKEKSSSFIISLNLNVCYFERK